MLFVTAVPMKATTARQILREALLGRQEKHPAYSMNSFARDMGVSKSYMSLILAGKRRLTLEQAARFGALLKFDKRTQTRFLKAARDEALGTTEALIAGAQPAAASFFELDVDRFKVIQDWYHLAILDLTTLRGFKSEYRWVARKLGLSEIKVRDAIDRLHRLGLLEISNGRWTKAHEKLYISTKRSETAIRSHHEQMMGKAIEELKRPERFGQREISGYTMAIGKNRIAEVTARLREMQREIAEFAAQGGDCSELYQLNMQFFSLLQE